MDLTRTVLYILLPLAFVLALVLVSQGVVQTFSQYKSANLLFQTATAMPTGDSGSYGQQDIWQSVRPLRRSPSSSLGTNGGGFFNVNSAHPFENPTPLSNFLEMLSILLIPAALVLHLRKDGRGHSAGLGHPGCHDHYLRGATGRYRLGRTDRQPDHCLTGCRHQTIRHQSGREHGRQGRTLRGRQLGPVGHRHHRRFEWLGQLDARLEHAAGRHDPDVADASG